MNAMLSRPKRVLVSVSDKSGLEKLAQLWSGDNVEIIASGGTALYLKDQGFNVTEVSSYSKSPEAFGGRMKTLSFPIFSGILFNRSSDRDVQEMATLGLKSIDVVVCNFYPFEKTLERKQGRVDETTINELVENVDIGGPSMVRACAKNFQHTVVLSSPDQYDDYINDYRKNNSQVSTELSFRLAKFAFEKCFRYDEIIYQTFLNYEDAEISKNFEAHTSKELFTFSKSKTLRYGENPHQEGTFLSSLSQNSYGLGDIEQIQGKELSYNNFLDMDAALKSLASIFQMTQEESLKSCAGVIIKHQNPCGLSFSSSKPSADEGERGGSIVARTLSSAWSCDPVSSFGGIIALNRKLDEDGALFLSQNFVEVVIAPSFSSKALDILESKKNLRLVKFDFNTLLSHYPPTEFRSVLGGALVQSSDCHADREFQVVTEQRMSFSKELLKFGISAAKSLKSNAIALVGVDEDSPEHFKLYGAGMGNPNRLVSYEQAYQKAKENGVTDFSKLVMTSDAFFPFDDIIQKASKVGIKSIVQPGGSIRDKEVIETSNKHQVAMVFTGRRHFLH